MPFYTELVLQHFGFSHQTVQGNYKNQTWLTTAVPLSSHYSFCGSNNNSTNVSCSIKLFFLAKIIYPISSAAPRCLTTGLLLCLSPKHDADFASHFLVRSALVVNCPWLNQLLPLPLTSFLLVYFIVHFAQCRAHSYSLHGFSHILHSFPPAGEVIASISKWKAPLMVWELHQKYLGCPSWGLCSKHQRTKAYIAIKSKQQSHILTTLHRLHRKDHGTRKNLEYDTLRGSIIQKKIFYVHLTVR